MTHIERGKKIEKGKIGSFLPPHIIDRQRYEGLFVFYFPVGREKIKTGVVAIGERKLCGRIRIFSFFFRRNFRIEGVRWKTNSDPKIYLNINDGDMNDGLS